MGAPSRPDLELPLRGSCSLYLEGPQPCRAVWPQRPWTPGLGVAPSSLSLLFIKDLFIFVVLGLCCCAWVFSSCGELGLVFIVLCGFIVVVASFVGEHRL